MKQSITLLLLFLGYIVSAADIYVSPSGSNSNPGTESQPFATIQHAIDQANAGTTIYVKSGTYTENLVISSKVGSGSTPITLRNYSNDKVFVDGGGTNAGSGSALCSITDSEFFLIQGVIFQNSINLWVKGLIINKGCKNIRVEDCVFKSIHFSDDSTESVEFNENASPLIVYGTDSITPIENIILRRNTIYNCRTGFSESVTLSGNVSSFLVEENTIHDVTNIGIVAAGHYGACPNPALDQARNGIISGNTVYRCVSPVAIAGGIYVDGGKNIIVEKNTCRYGQVGISIGCENVGKTTENISVRNNVIFRNAHAGIAVGGYSYPSGSGSVKNTLVQGNTTYRNDSNSNWVGEIWMTYCENVLVRNNIFFADNANKVHLFYQDNNGPGNAIDYNWYMSINGEDHCLFTYDGNGYSTFAAYQNASGVDANSGYGNPLFTEVGSFDFSLRLGSPAIDAGDPSFVASQDETDFIGGPRLMDVVDCGAFEYDKTIGLDQFSNGVIGIFPVPATNYITLTGVPDNGSVEVFSLDGTLNSDLVFEQGRLNIETLSPGLYLVRILNPETNLVHQAMFVKY